MCSLPLVKCYRHQHPTPGQAFVGQGHDRVAEVTQLKRRIAVLEMERDILKKAIGIFVAPRR